MTPNRRRFLHFFEQLCVPKTPSVSRDGSGARRYDAVVSRRSEREPARARAMNRASPPAPLVRPKGCCGALAPPPGGGTFQFQTFILAPSLEIWVKIFSV